MKEVPAVEVFVVCWMRIGFGAELLVMMMWSSSAVQSRVQRVAVRRILFGHRASRQIKKLR